jgi:hypothetical protein
MNLSIFWRPLSEPKASVAQLGHTSNLEEDENLNIIQRLSWVGSRFDP